MPQTIQFENYMENEWSMTMYQMTMSYVCYNPSLCNTVEKDQ